MQTNFDTDQKKSDLCHRKMLDGITTLASSIFRSQQELCQRPILLLYFQRNLANIFEGISGGIMERNPEGSLDELSKQTHRGILGETFVRAFELPNPTSLQNN